MSQASVCACKALAGQPQAIATKGLNGETFGLRSKRSEVRILSGVPSFSNFRRGDLWPRRAKHRFLLAEREQTSRGLSAPKRGNSVGSPAHTPAQPEGGAR